jgi:hypothetical protein
VAVVVQSFEVETAGTPAEGDLAIEAAPEEAPTPPLEREVERLVREAEARAARLRAT